VRQEIATELGSAFQPSGPISGVFSTGSAYWIGSASFFVSLPSRKRRGCEINVIINDDSILVVINSNVFFGLRMVYDQLNRADGRRANRQLCLGIQQTRGRGQCIGKDRCIFVIAYLIPGSPPAKAQVFPEYAHMDFAQYPESTQISNQYAAYGVTFSISGNASAYR